VSTNSERMLSSAERMRADAPLEVGQLVAAQYRVQRIVGVGGMGFVYEAIREQTGERVAIKCLLRSLASEPDCVTRFLREARSTASIASPHVVRVFEAGQDANLPPYFVMEFLDGQDLGAILEDSGPMPVEAAVAAVIQACLGVGDAHALGLVHRDLKPSNLILTKSGIKVVDFGISKVLLEGNHGGERLTQTTSVFGSPAYMSPEQVRSAKHVDGRTDVWALGVVLYELLSGRAPFAGDNSGAVLAAIIADETPQLRGYAPHVPEALERVVHACLVKDRARRIRSVAELAQRLAPFAPEQGGLALQVRSPQKLEESARPAFDASRTEPSFAIEPAVRNRFPKAFVGVLTGLCASGFAAAVVFFTGTGADEPNAQARAAGAAQPATERGPASSVQGASPAELAPSTLKSATAQAPSKPELSPSASTQPVRPAFKAPARGLPPGISERRK
jgi:eukaryotic-like serine/threonine-protein kinase